MSNTSDVPATVFTLDLESAFPIFISFNAILLPSLRPFLSVLPPYLSLPGYVHFPRLTGL